MSHADALSRNPVANGQDHFGQRTNTANVLKITTGDLGGIQLTDPYLNTIKCILNNNCTEAKDIKNNFV